MFWVFCLGIAEDVPVLRSREKILSNTQEHHRDGDLQLHSLSPVPADHSTQHLNLPTTLHHKDGRPVVLCADPVEKHPQVQILLLPKLQAVVNEMEAESCTVRESKEVSRSPHLLPLLLCEGGQPGAQPRFHASRVVSICKQGPCEPAQHMVQGALALSQAFQAGATGFDPMRGQRHGQLALLMGSVVAVVEMPCSCMSLEDKEADGWTEGKRRRDDSNFNVQWS